MGILSNLRKQWRDLKSSRPGHRFQDRYDGDSKQRQHVVWRIARIVGGVAAILVGLVEIVFPGPAVLFLFVGGALLATQSRAVAKLMDWAELKVRAVWQWGRRKWRSASHRLRAGVVAVMVCGGAASGYLMYRVVLQ